ncbi:MAG: hypothetical protein AYK19_08470 [Theionarchaea archaeon DG-70-1]|nr:MAG: hypothetical protein AYK19_08470 [Theionarchaea archaeon DG-70-1]
MPLAQDTINALIKDNSWEPYTEISEENIFFTLNNVQKPEIDFSIERRIESIWAQKVKEAQKQGQTLTSNPIFGVQSIERTENKYILNIYETTYKYVIATRNFQIPGYYEYFLGVRGICFFEVNETKYIILGEPQ